MQIVLVRELGKEKQLYQDQIYKDEINKTKLNTDAGGIRKLIQTSDINLHTLFRSFDLSGTPSTCNSFCTDVCLSREHHRKSLEPRAFLNLPKQIQLIFPTSVAAP